MTFIIWSSSTKRELLRHLRSSNIWIHWVAGKNILRHFHHQELCQRKVYVLCSAQKESIVSFAFAALMPWLGGLAVYISQSIAQFKLAMWKIQWNSFHSCQSRDDLGSSLGRGHLTVISQPKKRLNRIMKRSGFFQLLFKLLKWLGMTWIFLPKCFCLLYGFNKSLPLETAAFELHSRCNLCKEHRFTTKPAWGHGIVTERHCSCTSQSLFTPSFSLYLFVVSWSRGRVIILYLPPSSPSRAGPAY